MSDSALLVLEGIYKHYRWGETRVPALRGLDLRLEVGACVAVCGPSGSGKSTLLNICGLVDSPDVGHCLLAGEDTTRLDERARTRLRCQTLGFIFQGYNLVPVMSVAENVEYPLQLLGVAPAERRRRVARMLEQVGLASQGARLPDQLSGGQRQRVAIARALVKQPQLVIADEPTANLDSRTADDIIALMQGLGAAQGSTFLIATHDPRMSRQCGRVLYMQDGRWAAPEVLHGH